MTDLLAKDYTQEVKFLLKTILIEGLIFALVFSLINYVFRNQEFNPGYFVLIFIAMGLLIGVINLKNVRSALEEIPEEDRMDYNYNSYQKTRLNSTLSLHDIKAKVEAMKAPITKIKLENNVLTFKSKNELNWFGNMNTIVMEKDNGTNYDYKLISEPATVLSFRDYGRSYVNIIKMKKLLE